MSSETMASEIISSELGINAFTSIFPIFFILAVFLIIILLIISQNKKMKYALNKIENIIENGEGLDELKENIRLKEEKAPINLDFFNSKFLYGKLRYTSQNSLNYDLYPEENSLNPVTISEPLYTLGWKISFSRPLDRFKGVVLTKTKNNFILGEFVKGIFSVKIDNVLVGKIDVMNKKILDEKGKTIGELILPKNGTFQVNIGLGSSVKNTSYWELKFNNGNSAKIYLQHGTMKNILSPSGKYKLIIDENGTLTKKEKSIVLVLSNYLRIKKYLFQMLSRG